MAAESPPIRLLVNNRYAGRGNTTRHTPRSTWRRRAVSSTWDRGSCSTHRNQGTFTTRTGPNQLAGRWRLLNRRFGNMTVEGAGLEDTGDGNLRKNAEPYRAVAES